MPSLERKLLGPARLTAAWFVLWAGFWTAFFVLVGLSDPGSIDPGEPAAIARIFTWLGLASGVIFGCLANLASGRGVSILRCVLWGLLAASAPPAMLGKFNQILVLAPVGAAIGGALSYLGKKAMALSGEEAGGWVAAARFVGRGFYSGAAEAAAGPGSR
jgi:hypothetical protein